MKVQLLLDSGAFSAWNQGTTINLKQYMSYIKDHRKWIWRYVNLDVLPAGKESRRTLSDIEEGAKASYDNLQIMKSQGLEPIPVFHQGERVYWLERMLKDGETYIGLSARKDLRPRDIRKWLDEMFTILTDRQGRPFVLTHGFGITNPRLLLRYPFRTVDSTTWSLSAGFGNILVPPYRSGELDYSRPPYLVIVSDVVQKGSTGIKDFKMMSPLMQDHVLSFLREEVGCSIMEVRYSSDARRRAFLVYYGKLLEHLVDVRFRQKHNGFSISRKALNGSPVEVRPQIMFATSLKNKIWSELMNDVGASTRLLSYYELRDAKGDDFIEYVKTGICGERRQPKRIDGKPAWGNEAYLNHRRFASVRRMQEQS